MLNYRVIEIENIDVETYSVQDGCTVQIVFEGSLEEMIQKFPPLGHPKFDIQVGDPLSDCCVAYTPPKSENDPNPERIYSETKHIFEVMDNYDNSYWKPCLDPRKKSIQKKWYQKLFKPRNH